LTQQLEKLKEDFQEKDTALNELTLTYKALVKKDTEK
jgi:hypothetical protein